MLLTHFANSFSIYIEGHPRIPGPLDIVHIRMGVLLLMALHMSQRGPTFRAALKGHALPGCSQEHEIPSRPNRYDLACGMVNICSVLKGWTEQSDAQNAAKGKQANQ
jgi:hypothetical protein